MENENIFPPHGALTPPSILHLAFEISKEEYEEAKELLRKNSIEIESELVWEDRNSKSTYFRDPAGNLVEIITEGAWPVED
jgi:catechol 2,3-dioxygenase-like lactoylglutathione lyase family enzyme